MKQPLVSIVIPNYNGKKWLKGLLPTLEKTTYPNKEIIVVNNGSTDDSYNFLKKNYPDVRVIELKKNRGFAGANNIGVKKARGKYVLLLNNDTQVPPDFLEPIVAKMEKDKSIGVIQPMIRSLRKKSVLDASSSFFTSSGFMYHYGYYQPFSKPQYNIEHLVYSAKGACLFTRRFDYLELGGLDEDFITYVEESDYCHRIWLSGKKVIYYPKSHIFHWGGGDMSVMERSETTIYRSFKNRFYSYIKNLSLIELIKLLPVLFIFSEGMIFSALIRGIVKNALSAQMGTLWWMFHLPTILKKRRYIQSKIRKVQDSDFIPLIKHDPPLSYYMHFLRNPEAKYDEPPIRPVRPIR